MQPDPKMKILLVEDTPTMRRMEINILRQLGFEVVVEAVDGKDAIGKIQAHPDIRLVISDLNMPNMGGMELLHWVRSSQAHRALPFLIASGESDRRAVTQAREAGASGVVTKPFSPDELKNAVNESFGIKTEPETPPAPVSQNTADGRRLLKVAHIQITDHLALGVMKHQIESGAKRPQTFALETRCMGNWNMVQGALEKGEVDAACILAPAAMDLFNYGVPIRLVLFAHRNGSITVRNKVGEYRKPYQQFFKHKTFLIPYKMSVHNMLAHKYFSEMGLRPGVSGKEAVNVLFDVVAPINMPEFLAENPNVSGFMVAEPIGSRAINAGIAEKLFLSSEIWNNHPCCVLVFRQDIISRHTDAVHEFTDLFVDAGRFIQSHPKESAEIAVSFLDPQKKIGLKPQILQGVLTQPGGIRTDLLFPVLDDLDVMQRYMVEKMGIGQMIDVEKFVDTRFASISCKDEPVVMRPESRAIEIRTSPDHPTASTTAAHDSGPSLLKSTATATREGKYLVFMLANERYGLSIMDVKEIIRMVPITAVASVPAYVKGIINLRNKTIPIVDIRLKFGLPGADYNERTCIIVVEIAGVSGSRLIGVVVDTVMEVSDIKDEVIQDTPDFGTSFTNYITGIAKLPNGVTILLDIEHALAS